MRTESGKREFLIFIGVLAVVAIAITACFVAIHISRQNAAIARQAAEAIAAQDGARQATDEQARKEAEAEHERQQAASAKAEVERVAAEKAANLATAEKAHEDALAVHAAELAKYLNGSFARKPGIMSVAVTAASEDGTLNRHIGGALAHRFKTNTVEMLPSLFTSEFLSDGLFAETFSGSRAPLARLDLLQSLDGLVLARENVEYSQNPSLENTISAHMQVDVTTMPVAATGNGETWTLIADGVGFKRDEARSMAEERLIKQITEATNMLLNLNPSGDH